jgi:hypothetical protein
MRGSAALVDRSRRCKIIGGLAQELLHLAPFARMKGQEQMQAGRDSENVSLQVLELRSVRRKILVERRSAFE